MSTLVTIDLEELFSILSDKQRQEFFIDEFDFFDEAQPGIMVKLFDKMCDSDKEEAIINILNDMDGNAHHVIVDFIKQLPTELWKHYADLSPYLKWEE